jgi:hypothetical protein
MTAFYRLLDDVQIPGRWHLGETRSPDGDEKWLDGGEPCEEDEVVVEVTHPGVVLDFSLTSFNAPIATRALALAIASIGGADIQLVRASIAGQVGFDLLNAVRVVSCLDERQSEFIKWKAGDHRSDLIGQYRQVTRLVLDPTRIPPGAHIFRVDGWRVALIVSEKLRSEMERVGCRGARFQPVSR